MYPMVYIFKVNEELHLMKDGVEGGLRISEP